tara:strand:- start:2380 stop:3069 length:690 start_codon:yes stop_codon:yes gene_type:complete
MKVTNENIKQFLEVAAINKDYYATDADKALIRNYDACDDRVLSDNLIEKVWKHLSSKFVSIDNILNGAAVNVLHVNAGQGKVIEAAPTNTIITSYHQDFICKQISDFLNQKRTATNSITYHSSVFDISYFYMGGNHFNNPKYDIVFHQVVNNTSFRTYDNKYSALPYSIYYPLRALEFVTKGGYLCVFSGNKNTTQITSNELITNKVEGCEVMTEEDLSHYNCLIFKKK